MSKHWNSFEGADDMLLKDMLLTMGKLTHFYACLIRY